MCELPDPYRGACGSTRPTSAGATPRTCADARRRRGRRPAPGGVLRRVAAGLRRPDRATPTATSRRPSPTCATPAGCASPTRCRSASAGSATHFWGFEPQGVVPDIVTLGKPIGNGHPLGAVVTTPEIAALVRDRDGVLQHVRRQPGLRRDRAGGARRARGRAAAGPGAACSASGCSAGLRELAGRHELIGDVRGAGLFLGVELVRPRDPRARHRRGGGRRRGGQDPRDPALDRRPGRQRAQDQAAAGARRGGRRPGRRGARYRPPRVIATNHPRQRAIPTVRS